MNTHQAMDALKAWFDKKNGRQSFAPKWVVFPELRLGAGYGPDVEQRLDVWAMNVWPSAREMVAVEIKVSRSDWKRELRKPTKRKLALFYSNRFYFAAPTGLIAAAELPAECGLLEIADDGAVSIAVQAPWRDCHPPSWHFLGAIARRAAAMQGLWRKEDLR